MGLAVHARWSRRAIRRAARRVLPPRPTLTSLEAKIMAGAWTLAAVATLGVALAQGLRMFLLSAMAVVFGTLAAMWMLDGLSRR